MSGGDCDWVAGELSRRGPWLDGGRAGRPWGLGPEAPGDRVGRLRLVEASSAESWGRPAGIEAEVQAVSLDSRPPSLLDLIDVMDPLPGLTGVAGRGQGPGQAPSQDADAAFGRWGDGVGGGAWARRSAFRLHLEGPAALRPPGRGMAWGWQRRSGG